jgi:hypothetical protein
MYPKLLSSNSSISKTATSLLSGMARLIKSILSFTPASDSRLYAVSKRTKMIVKNKIFVGKLKGGEQDPYSVLQIIVIEYIFFMASRNHFRLVIASNLFDSIVS